MPRLDRFHSDDFDYLFQAILSLEDMEECQAFFGDLFTIQELKTFSQRLQVARCLLQGDTYDAIRKQVQVSSSTITRINTELQFGSGGYGKIIRRIDGEAPADE